MKHSFKKIISIAPLFAFSLALGFNSSLSNDNAVLVNNVVSVKRAVSTEGIDSNLLTFDSDIGILGGLLPNTIYHLVPLNCPEPIETNSYELTSNANGEISLLDDIGEVDIEVDPNAKEVYGTAFEGIYMNSAASIVKFNERYKFPTKKDCLMNLITTEGYIILENEKIKIVNDNPSNALDKEQERFYEIAKSQLSSIYNERDGDGGFDYTPGQALEEALNIVKYEFTEKAEFVNYRTNTLIKIGHLNDAYNDSVIGQLIVDATNNVEKFTVDNNTIDDIKNYMKEVSNRVDIRKNVCDKQKLLTTKLNDDVDTRTKPLQLHEKAYALKDVYLEKIENAKTIEEANKLYDEFVKEIDNLIVSSSWGKYCYLHWIYIVVLAFYAIYFIIRTWILKCKKLDVFNIIAVSIFAVCSIVFTIFSACDLCTIMLIAGWSFLILTVAIYGIYTIVGKNDPVLKTITNEDIERKNAKSKN